jgi:hypothetical protein
MDSSQHHLIAASRVEGAPVFTADGEKIGHVEDLMIEKVSGKAAYALMGFDGFLGVGERFYPLPWSMLTYDPERGGYVAPVSKAQLENGHAVSDREVEDEIDWREAVHAYYGATPYWMGAPVVF